MYLPLRLQQDHILDGGKRALQRQGYQEECLHSQRPQSQNVLNSQPAYGHLFALPAPSNPNDNQRGQMPDLKPLFAKTSHS